MTDLQLKIPAGAREVLNVLTSAGFEACVVGGCVRDSLLGREPNDWDICTSALPEEVILLFSGERQVIETGMKHGTVTVLMPDGPYEITTFRVDGDYSDHRHPDRVSFTPSLTEDLARRDFTMNAMAYHPEQGLIDPFHGREDLKIGLIRCVGSPAIRFEEDALRMMRAIRFASVFGFELEPETEQAVLGMHALLQKVSAERLMAELGKLLMGDGVEEVMMRYRDVIAELIPELKDAFDCTQVTPWHCYPVYRHIAVSVEKSKKDPLIRLTMLLHDIAKPVCATHEGGKDHFRGHPERGAEMTDEILKRLKVDSFTRETVTELVRIHDREVPATVAAARRLLSQIGVEQYSRLVEVKTADMLAQSEWAIEQKRDGIRNMRILAAQILSESAPIALKDLEINGEDLLALGMNPGPELGQLLTKLLDSVLEDPSSNKREILLSMAEKLMESTFA